MKKKTWMIVLLALLGCAVIVGGIALLGQKTEPIETTPVVQDPVAPATDPEPQTEPVPETEPEPEPLEWVPGIARAGYAGAVKNEVNLGDKVTVIGEYDGYFIIEGQEHDLLIETRYLRHAGEEAFEEKDGYSYGNTPVYGTAHLDTIPESDEDVIATLSLNTKVTVIEGKENWLHIKWDENEGYVDAEDISDNYISYRPSGGGGSGPADGTDIDLSGLSSGAAQNGGIVLLGAYHGPAFTQMDATEGVILTNECEAYLYLFDRDETVKVHEVGEDFCVVVIGDKDLTAVVPRWLIRMEGDAAYESWTGYARNNASVYSKYQMREIYLLDNLNTNTEVLVIDELKDFYVVQIDGAFRYMRMDEVSENRIVYRGGGGSGGSSSGDWTPPAL